MVRVYQCFGFGFISVSGLSLSVFRVWVYACFRVGFIRVSGWGLSVFWFRIYFISVSGLGICHLCFFDLFLFGSQVKGSGCRARVKGLGFGMRGWELGV